MKLSATFGIFYLIFFCQAFSRQITHFASVMKNNWEVRHLRKGLVFMKAMFEYEKHVFLPAVKLHSFMITYKNKICVDRESNPELVLGRHQC